MLSNPEAVAFYDTGKCVHIFHSVKKPLSSGEANWNGKKFNDIIISSKSLKKLCSEFRVNNGAFLKINKKKLSATRQIIFNKTGKKVPKNLLQSKNFNKLNKYITSCRVKLTYGSQWVYLWETTWEHLLNNILKDT